MKVLKRIYKAPIEVILNTPTTTYITTKYQDHIFYGFSNCHDDDLDFSSMKVGYHIALTRARIEMLKYAVQHQKEVYGIKWQSYKDIIAIKSKEEIDPTGLFLQNINQSKKKIEILQKALKREKAHLTEYISDQEKVVQSLRRMRSEQKAKDE